MKKIILLLACLFSFSVTTLFLITPVAEAASCNGVETSIDLGCNDYDTDSISGIIMYVINFLAIGVGIAVLAGIAWGGFTYARAGGDTSATKQGMDTIRNAVIGLVLFIFMYAAVDFMVPGGAFNLNEKPKAVPAAQTKDKTEKESVPGKKITSLRGVRNFRDASGSGIIKPGVLYRSGHLSGADKNEVATLLAGGTVIDLRTANNIKKDGKDVTAKGVTNKNIDIVGTTNYTKFVNGKAGETASKEFGQVIKTIAHSDGPVLIHCTHGKDRTGWTIAMVMYALGANDKQVMAEYLKSAGQTAGKNVTKDMLNNGLSAVKKKYGTVKKYLTEGLGLTTNDIAALKKKLGA